MAYKTSNAALAEKIRSSYSSYKHSKSYSKSSEGEFKISTSVAEVSSSAVSRTTTFDDGASGPYVLYKWRFVGLIALALLNITAGLTSTWLFPLSEDLAIYSRFSITQIGWLSGAGGFVSIPGAVFVPAMHRRWGMRTICFIASAFLLVSGWLRYAGTTPSLHKGQSYGVLMLAQMIAAFPVPMLQVLASVYSETWFDVRGRTTATTVISLSYFVGEFVAPYISPLTGSFTSSMLLLAIIQTVVALFSFAVKDKPPTPPTYAATRTKSGSWKSLGRAMFGREPETSEAYMTKRQRMDFFTVVSIFNLAVIVTGALTSYMTAILMPYGYSMQTCEWMTAIAGISGLGISLIIAPLFDHVWKHRLALWCKIFAPILGFLWFSLIWAVKANNTTCLYVIMALVGFCCGPIFPIALEFAAEVSTNTLCSSAWLWFSGRGTWALWASVATPLTSSLTATPPRNMHQWIILLGVVAITSSLGGVAISGRLVRRERDEAKLEDAKKNFCSSS